MLQGGSARGRCVRALLALSAVLDSPELQLPPAAHNLRWRLRHDRKLQDRLRGRARVQDTATGSRTLRR